METEKQSKREQGQNDLYSCCKDCLLKVGIMGFLCIIWPWLLNEWNEAKRKDTVFLLKIINNLYQQYSVCDNKLAQEGAYDDTCTWWKEMGSYLVALILLVLLLSLSLVWIRTTEPGLHLLWSPWLRWSNSRSCSSLSDRVFPNVNTGSDLCWAYWEPSAITIYMKKRWKKGNFIIPFIKKRNKSPEDAEHAELNLNLLSPGPSLKYLPSLILSKSWGCYNQL